LTDLIDTLTNSVWNNRRRT